MLLVMSKVKMEDFVRKYGSLFAFLAIEVLLFTSLNLANYGVIYRYLAFFLSLALLPFPLLANKQNDWLDFIGLACPLFIFGLFMVLSTLYSVYLESFVGNLAILLGLLSFLFMGYALSKNKDFQIEKALMAIFGGLAVLLGISLCITMYRYAPFYVVTYAGKVIYYDGEVYNLSEEAKWLYAFTIKEVNLDHFGLYSVVVSSVFGGLLFSKPKQKNKMDLFWLAIGGVGLMSIVLLPNVAALPYLIAPLAIMLIIRFYPRGPKALKYGSYVIYGLFGVLALCIVLFAINAFGNASIQSFFSNNILLNKLVNNSHVLPWTYVFSHCFEYPFGGLYDIYISGTIVESTKSFLFDTLYQGGLFSFIGLIIFITVAFFSLIRYFRKSQDKPIIKGLIISFIISFFIYAMFDYQYVQMVHELDLKYKSPFASDLLLLLVVFLIGYTFTPKALQTKKATSLAKTE